MSKFSCAMKIFFTSFLFTLSVIFVSGCREKNSKNPENLPLNNSLAVPDTGFTGIKQYMSGEYLIKEVTFRNGVREGLMKSFYQSGKLRQSFIYRNGLRQDSVIWFYEEGQVFRTTPYINDTIDGIQKQFYRDGKLKARLTYRKGLRTPTLEEFTPEGKLVKGYPDLIVIPKDDYRSRGIYSITLQLSDKSSKVRFYRGEFYNGVFDTARISRIKTVDGTGKLELKKKGSSGNGYVGIIAEIMTGFGNNYLVYKKITFPYGDLN
jgi:hypothetical protein